jgi:hypothetical protein
LPDLVLVGAVAHHKWHGGRRTAVAENVVRDLVAYRANAVALGAAIALAADSVKPVG